MKNILIYISNITSFIYFKFQKDNHRHWLLSYFSICLLNRLIRLLINAKKNVWASVLYLLNWAPIMAMSWHRCKVGNSEQWYIQKHLRFQVSIRKCVNMKNLVHFFYCFLKFSPWASKHFAVWKRTALSVKWKIILLSRIITSTNGSFQYFNFFSIDKKTLGQIGAFAKRLQLYHLFVTQYWIDLFFATISWG